ncbi:tRNA1(Val) (adenine(37)-N6)-methyltransferase [Spirosoma koreense]
MFRFKQFTIHQDRTAMKVCTDACVLGAYADVTTGRVEHILDIGTGTGLLALMAAQRNLTATVDAVEIDDSAYGQAQENIAASPFAPRIKAIHSRIQEVTGPTVYDRILTNPPFYTNHLRSPDASVNRALHTDDLSFGDLLAAVTRLLTPDGQWWVLLPPYETTKLTEQASVVGLFPFHTLFLRHNTRKPAFRVVTGFSWTPKPVEEDKLTIYELDGQSQAGSTYTDEFRTLLRDFYLIF